MKNIIIFFIVGSISFGANAQDTFSIVALDNETGEIGSAGATCLDDDDIAGGALIISDIIVGKGAVHTQSFWNPQNQALAHEVLNEGNNAKDIIEILKVNDAENNPSVRQYGVVTFAGDESQQSAAFTGENCFDFKKHSIGTTFAVQGNILLNESVVDNMVENFINTTGPLHNRLMAAMQGANIPGADSRCLNEGVSSRSAFIRVAKPTDTNDDLWMDLLVSKTPNGVEPIDSLQKLFDEFINTTGLDQNDALASVTITPNPSNGMFWVENIKNNSLRIKVLNYNGQVLMNGKLDSKGMSIDISEYNPGVYILRIENGEHDIENYKIIRL